MSISIIVPMYNVEEYLNECLESLLTNESDFEVLLIDDGSTDNTKEIALDFVKRYPNIFNYYYKKNGGLGDARNYAIPLSHKEYIMFLDSDDFLKENAIDTCNLIIERKKVDIIVFDLITYFSHEVKNVMEIYNGKKSCFISTKEYLNGIPAAWNKVIKKSVLCENNILFPKSLWYEDLATTPLYAKHANKIFYLNDGLYFYRQRMGSIMNVELYNPKMMDMIKSLSRVYEHFYGSQYQSEIENLYIHHLLFHHTARLLKFNKIEEIICCIKELNKKFPNWKSNLYFKNKSFNYRFFCRQVEHKRWFVCKILLMLKSYKIH